MKKLTFRMAALAMALIAAVTLTVPLAAWADSGDSTDGLKAMLGLKAKVTLVAPKSITRSEGKAVRVIDNRKI